MILQLRQIFLTEANTFISHLSSNPHRGPCRAAASDSRFLIPDPYFARNVIRARERSYGDTSTVTLSPGKILM